MNECDVYAHELRLLGLGHPLYEPNPTDYDRVRIGDVGFIHSLGYFQRIFNVFYDANHAFNERFGVPEGFTVVDEKYRTELELAGCPEGSHFKSQHVQSIEFSASADVQGCVCLFKRISRVLTLRSAGLSPGASVKFRSSKHNSRAAVLFLPNGAKYRVAQAADGYLRAYAKRHCRYWAEHIKATGLIGERQSLFFVTGHHLTNRWATAVHRSTEREAEGRMGMYTAWIGGSLALRTSSAEEFDVPLRVGPMGYPEANTDDGQSSASSSSLMEVEHRAMEPRWNQCVFLRGFWIVEKEFRPFKLKLKAAAGSDDLDMDQDEEANDKVFSPGRVSDSEGEEDAGIADKVSPDVS